MTTCRRIVLTVLVASLVPAVLDSAGIALQGRLAGEPARWNAIVWQGSEWLIFGALTPLAFFASRRFPLRWPIAWRHLAWHVASTLVLCLVWATLGMALRWVLQMGSPGDDAHRQWLSWVLTSMPWSVFMYFAVAGSVHAFALWNETQASQPPAPGIRAAIGVGKAEASPPSEPYRRISRIRLSSQVSPLWECRTSARAAATENSPSVVKLHHALRPHRRSPARRVAPLRVRSIPPRRQTRSLPAVVCPSSKFAVVGFHASPSLRPFPPAAFPAFSGTTGALTPATVSPSGSSPRLLLTTFPAFRPQPPHRVNGSLASPPSAAIIPSRRHRALEQLATRWNRIRFVILRTTGSLPAALHLALRRRSCLPLRGPWLASTGTSTPLAVRHHGRTNALR